MKTKVKICGMRTLGNAESAIKAGADFLGFNFVPTSKRYITPVKAQEIIEQLRINGYDVQGKIVGVFQNQSVDEVNTIAALVGLDLVQLHGEESKEYMKKIKKEMIKTMREKELPMVNEESNSFAYLLLDRQIQGEGGMVDLEKAKELAQQFPLFFAGGVTCENVASIVSTVKPFAVDVAGGIETDGVIDTEKLALFIQRAKGVTI